MSLWQEYLRPQNLDSALKLMSTATRPVLPIAGGTDLLLDLEQGRHTPVYTLLDVTGIAEMLTLEIRTDRLFIGAGIPISHVTSNPLIARHAQALLEAGNLIGGPQVRNVATLGGNVAHALPAADGTIALLALDAKAEVAGQTGNREIPLCDLFLGPGKSALKAGEELLVGFWIKAGRAGQASAFKRIMRPQGVALPIINLAIWLDREADRVKDIRVAVGPGAPTPWRARDAEMSLIDKPMNPGNSNAALQALLAHVGFRSSPRRASSDYRRELTGTLFMDTLLAAWERAR